MKFGLARDDLEPLKANTICLCILLSCLVSSLLVTSFFLAPDNPAGYDGHDSLSLASNQFEDLPSDLQAHYGKTAVLNTAERMARFEELYQISVARRKAKVGYAHLSSDISDIPQVAAKGGVDRINTYDGSGESKNST